MINSAEQPFSPERLSPTEKQRFAYIEGRPDLFETRLLSIGKRKAQTHESPILFATREPGSANALLPIMEYLNTKDDQGFFVLTDGRAQELVQNKFSSTDRTAESAMTSMANVQNPKLIISDPSNSEQGLETFTASAYHETPFVLVEDYYTSSLNYLQSIQERNTGYNNLRTPDVICVMDEEAKKIIIERFPDLSDRIIVTGQPRFDQISNENTEMINLQTREKLGIPPDVHIISYMAQMESIDTIQGLADNLKAAYASSGIIFRKHPRDSVPYEKFEKIFKEAGITLINSNMVSTSEVNAASDLVITGWSTEGLDAIYRGKPTIHITDPTKQDIPKSLKLPLPPVKLGASVGINDINELSKTIREITDPNSSVNAELHQAMKQYYPSDGKNTERVVTSIKEKLNITL